MQDIIDIWEDNSDLNFTSTIINIHDHNWGAYGWICPRCKRTYSPYMYTCVYCAGTKRKENQNEKPRTH